MWQGCPTLTSPGSGRTIRAMPTPNDPVPNTLQMVLNWGDATTVRAQNVLHFLNTGAVAVNQGLADQLDTAVKAQFASSGLPTHIQSGVGLRNISIRNLAIANQAAFTGSGALSAGSDPGESLPGAVRFVITLRTALAGRSFRGRVYLWGFTEAASNGATAVAGVPTAAQTFVDGVRTSLGSTPNIDMSIVSRYTQGALRPTPLSTEVTLVQARNSIWDIQRRSMLPGGGTSQLFSLTPQLEVRPASDWLTT